MKLQIQRLLHRITWLVIGLTTAFIPQASARGEGPLPEFSYKGVRLHPQEMTFAARRFPPRSAQVKGRK